VRAALGLSHSDVLTGVDLQKDCELRAGKPIQKHRRKKVVQKEKESRPRSSAALKRPRSSAVRAESTRRHKVDKATVGQDSEDDKSEEVDASNRKYFQWVCG
jgi:hypothetical protein